MSNPPNGAARPEARALLAALHPAMVALMDELSGVMFCAKDADGRYVLVNQVFVGRTRERSRRDVIGKRAVDLFVPELAERYESQDELVRTTDKPLRGELELIRHVGGAPGWFLTSKLPLHDESGAYVGLVSVSQDLRSGDADDATIQAMARLRVDRAAHLLTSTTVPLADVASAAGFYDQPSFTRTFARLTGETPSSFRRRSPSQRDSRR